MPRLILTCRVLMTVFLVICVGVHVKGVLSPFSSEPLWSHIVHIISYSMCMVSVVRPFSWAWVAYTIGAIYPFMYHARCTWTQYTIHNKWSVVCILVVVLLPAGLAPIWRETRGKAV